MALTSKVSVPVKLLHEAEGHDVTIELKSGELYRGKLLASEETMNVHLSTVVHQGRDGRVTRLEHVYLRGNHIRFVVLPEILLNAPLFRKVQEFAAAKAKPVNLGRGRGRGGGGRGRGRGGAARGGGRGGGGPAGGGPAR